MTRIGVVILARYNSTRLPGKALRLIACKPVLQYILERIMRVFDNENIVLATSDQYFDDPIAEFAKVQGVKCYRGSLNNVAERFYNAALINGFDYAVRINGDNIFVDTELLMEMKGIALCGKYDFISNVKNRSFPRGMSIEIVRLNYFFNSMTIIQKTEKYKEHVTLCFYELFDEGHHFYVINKELPEASDIQLALDTDEDLIRCTKIIERFELPHWNYNLKGIYKILKELNYV